MKSYLVGGAVRDALLGLPVKDRDYVVVGATPQAMLAQGFRAVGRDFPVFLHPESGEEYALARMERKTGRGHQAFDFAYDPSVTLEEDLLRRDLTINAIAQDADGRLIDPYGGVADIAERRLRHVSTAFAEDPLRVLRLLRFHARFAAMGFEIADETWQLCREMVASGELNDLTAERVWAECEKALSYAQPTYFFAGLWQLDAMSVVLGSEQLDERSFTAMQNALLAACANHTDSALRLAAWLLPDSTAADAMMRKLPLPRRYQHWINLLQHHADTARHWADSTAEARYAMLKSCGSLRQSGELPDMLRVLGVKGAAAQRIRQQATLLQQLDVAALQAQGFRGAALGQAIKSAQLAILKV